MSSVNNNIGLGVFGILLTIWIIVANVALIISILMHETRRRTVFCLHIVNIAVADLLVGVVVVPIIADYLLKGSWELGDDACQFSVIADVLLCTVSITAIVMINCDRFIFLTCPPLERSRYIICCLMIMIPWLVGLALVLPLWILGKEETDSQDDNCLLVLRDDYKIPSLFISFFVPAFLAIGVNIAILLMMFVLRHRLEKLPVKRRVEKPKLQMLSLCIVSAVFIAMWAPFFVVSLLMSAISYRPPNAVLVFTVWFGYSNSAVNPLLWLVYTPTRKGITSLVCCCYKNNELSADKPRDVDDSKHSMIAGHDDVFELSGKVST